MTFHVNTIVKERRLALEVSAAIRGEILGKLGPLARVVIEKQGPPHRFFATTTGVPGECPI